MKVHADIQFLCIITNHGIADKIVSEIGAKLNFCHIAMGRGTAASEVLSLLSLDGFEKDVLLCTVVQSELKEVFKVLSEKFRFENSGNGIAFTIPVISVGGGVTLRLLSGDMNILGK